MEPSPQPLLTVVIPAYNEEALIEATLRHLEAYLSLPHEVIVVDDHSTDRTAVVVQQVSRDFPHLRLLPNLAPQGITHALQTGFRAARAEVVVSMMADLCDDPQTLPLMFERIQQGYDVVCASRYIPGGQRQGGPRVQAVFSWWVGASLHWLMGLPTRDASNAFKMYRKEVLDRLPMQEAGFASSLEIIVKAHLAGYRITEVPTTWQARTAGRSSFKMLRVAANYLRWYGWGIWQRWRCVKRKT
jgi:glycosyltransferase involved in cell wall biosynthesis